MLDYMRILLGSRLARLDERGASAVEYGLLITGVAAVMVLMVYAFGGMVTGLFTHTCGSVAAAAGNAGAC
jgi:pilus assembly protein Flp/PilA